MKKLFALLIGCVFLLSVSPVFAQAHKDSDQKQTTKHHKKGKKGKKGKHGHTAKKHDQDQDQQTSNTVAK